MSIQLGEKVRDTITGLEGIATARCLYIHGCDHIGIQPKADKAKGTVPKLIWVDSPQVEYIGTRKKTHTPPMDWEQKATKRKRRIGGPGQHPGESEHPEYDDGRFLNE